MQSAAKSRYHVCSILADTQATNILRNSHGRSRSGSSLSSGDGDEESGIAMGERIEKGPREESCNSVSEIVGGISEGNGGALGPTKDVEKNEGGEVNVNVKQFEQLLRSNTLSSSSTLLSGRVARAIGAFGVGTALAVPYCIFNLLMNRALALIQTTRTIRRRHGYYEFVSRSIPVYLCVVLPIFEYNLFLVFLIPLPPSSFVCIHSLVSPPLHFPGCFNVAQRLPRLLDQSPQEVLGTAHSPTGMRGYKLELHEQKKTVVSTKDNTPAYVCLSLH